MKVMKWARISQTNRCLLIMVCPYIPSLWINQVLDVINKFYSRFYTEINHTFWLKVFMGLGVYTQLNQSFWLKVFMGLGVYTQLFIMLKIVYLSNLLVKLFYTLKICLIITYF